MSESSDFSWYTLEAHELEVLRREWRRRDEMATKIGIAYLELRAFEEKANRTVAQSQREEEALLVEMLMVRGVARSDLEKCRFGVNREEGLAFVEKK